MIRKQQKRAARGKNTAFRVGGQEVDSKRIARFVRRYSSTWENEEDHSTDQEPRTPSDMSCYTPEPEDQRPGLGSDSSTTPIQLHPDDKFDGVPDSEPDLDADEGDGGYSHSSVSGKAKAKGKGKSTGNRGPSHPSTGVQSSSSSERHPLKAENVKQEEDQQQQQQQQPELTWQDFADYQERMALLHKQMQESMGPYIDPTTTDDESVGCLLNDRSRLW